MQRHLTLLPTSVICPPDTSGIDNGGHSHNHRSVMDMLEITGFRHHRIANLGQELAKLTWKWQWLCERCGNGAKFRPVFISVNTCRANRAQVDSLGKENERYSD